MNQNTQNQASWDEETSRQFIDYGRYVVPERERQIRIIVDLVPRCKEPCLLVELCCGEGLLAEALLERFPAATVLGLDGSREMLQQAQQKLARFGERFQCKLFDLAAISWRQFEQPIHTVVSSLAIHHLSGPQKQALFCDVQRMLAEGGVFVIADLVEPAHQLGQDLAAQAWDEAVRLRSLELDGDTAAFDFFQREGWNTYRYLDPDDIDQPSRLFDQLKWLEAAGFADVDVFWMLAGHAIFGARKDSVKLGQCL